MVVQPGQEDGLKVPAVLLCGGEHRRGAMVFLGVHGLEEGLIIIIIIKITITIIRQHMLNILIGPVADLDLHEVARGDRNHAGGFRSLQALVITIILIMIIIIIMIPIIIFNNTYN